MSMIGCLKRATDEQLAQLLANPELIEPFLYGDMAEKYVPPRAGCLGRLLGMKPPKPDPASPLTAAGAAMLRAQAGSARGLPDDWPEAQPGDEIDLDKAWHGLHYLLTGSDWEGDEPLCYLVCGGQEIGDVDVGYGPARALTAEQVRNWAGALAVVSEGQLRERYDPEQMMALSVYPTIWDEGEEALQYLLEGFVPLRDFVRGTAEQGKGLVVWLS